MLGVTASLDSISRPRIHGNTIFGIEIVTSHLCVKRDKQIRFPRSKKKRIRKKWAAQDKNWRFIPTQYQMGNKIICHPEIVARLREEFSNV